ncbi:hypothetical protein ACFWJW_03980 [Streptomyces sp. NPDC127097]|uniref:hypothetical protein n=1 Tax=Streptomyces sp. NPDC127097 TaxID=3347136 RepID=UPI0036627062
MADAHRALVRLANLKRARRELPAQSALLGCSAQQQHAATPHALMKRLAPKQP